MTLRLKSLRRDARGSTVIEFAIVAPILCMSLMAFFDFGYNIYAESVMEGVLHEAARGATVGNVTGDEIDAFVERRLLVFAHNADLTIEKNSYSEFSRVKNPEKLARDRTAPWGVYNRGDCFEDSNPNGSFDLDQGRAGLGGAEDIVNYEVTMTYDRMFPISGFLGISPTKTIHVSVPLRNQPFAARNQVTTICTEV